jgi:hypothetical protein
VSRRVQRLGPDTRKALSTASVIGRDFDLGLLGELLGEDPMRTFERRPHPTGVRRVAHCLRSRPAHALAIDAKRTADEGGFAALGRRAEQLLGRLR